VYVASLAPLTAAVAEGGVVLGYARSLGPRHVGTACSYGEAFLCSVALLWMPSCTFLFCRQFWISERIYSENACYRTPPATAIRGTPRPITGSKQTGNPPLTRSPPPPTSHTPLPVLPRARRAPHTGRPALAGCAGRGERVLSAGSHTQQLLGPAQRHTHTRVHPPRVHPSRSLCRAPGPTTGGAESFTC
jgi:hypothetical protein